MADTAGLAAAAAVSLTTSTALVKGMAGLLPKAQLYVPKSYTLVDMDAVSAVTGNNDVVALKSLLKTKRTRNKAAIADTGIKARLMQMTPATLVGLQIAEQVSQAAITTAMSQKAYNVMEVQYNPSSIRMSNSAGSTYHRQSTGDAGASQVRRSANMVRTSLSVDLVFEDINVSDSFHLENLNMNAEDLLQTAASFAFNTFGDGYSVQKPCEGLVSLLNFKKLKQVVFLWSGMFFHGELTGVDVTYEMFNKLGNPVLAKVNLTIEQNDTVGTIHYASDDDQWNEAIDLAFGDATASGIANLFS